MELPAEALSGTANARNKKRREKAEMALLPALLRLCSPLLPTFYYTPWFTAVRVIVPV